MIEVKPISRLYLLMSIMLNYHTKPWVCVHVDEALEDYEPVNELEYE